MKKRIFVLLTILIFILSGCTPKIVVTHYLKSVIKGKPDWTHRSEIDPSNA